MRLSCRRGRITFIEYASAVAGIPQELAADGFDAELVWGKVAANAAIVPAGQNGSVSVFVTNPTDVILDINGYFAP